MLPFNLSFLPLLIDIKVMDLEVEAFKWSAIKSKFWLVSDGKKLQIVPGELVKDGWSFN